MTTEAIVNIDHLGAQGDGRARVGNAVISVPLTLAGETVRIQHDGARGHLLEILSPSPDRAPPPCRHFGTCGGCSLQHLGPDAYRAFKRDQIVRALAMRGLTTEVSRAWITPPGSRRRAAFAAVRAGKDVRLGFHVRRSHAVIDLEACPVLSPAVLAPLGFLRTLAQALAPPTGALSLAVTETATGLDLLVTGLAARTPMLARMEAAAAALRHGFARAAIEGIEPLTERRPAITIGGAVLLPTPGGFLQASAAAEAELARRVALHVHRCTAIADLFAGCGTFALRLAQTARVHAAESSAPAMAALAEAARAAPGLKPVSTETRDLFRAPLLAAELGRFDAVVLDPPRAGAAAQVAELAASRVPKIAYVSCDPATLARDLRVLVDGGYHLERVDPVDQFLWSAHVEAVAALSRTRA
jgi:23S rRNA (uracil1939-C5)-methyltransferase